MSSQYGPIVLGLGNATGTLIVENGGNVQGPEGRIGIGSATVRGNGSVWYSYNSGLYVGSGGTPNASLDILSGGLVKTGLLKIYNGLVRVDNGSSTVAGLEISGVTGEISGGTNGQLVVGDTTAGRMVINNGGAVIGFRGFLGGNPGGIGSALVTDPRSRWNASGSIWVGNSGNCTLDVLFGGTVTSTGNGYLVFSNNTPDTRQSMAQSRPGRWLPIFTLAAMERRREVTASL